MGSKKVTPRNKYKFKLYLSQARALELLWRKHGGSQVLGLSLGFTRSVLNVWKRTTGHVPLIHVGVISRALKLSPYLLNYQDVYRFYGKGPTWREVVIESGLFYEKELEYIFNGKEPVVE